MRHLRIAAGRRGLPAALHVANAAVYWVVGRSRGWGYVYVRFDSGFADFRSPGVGSAGIAAVIVVHGLFPSGRGVDGGLCQITTSPSAMVR
jgi:hypothetical protein